MQNVAGTLSPGAHPGGFNGQDAYNDMLVITNESSERRERTASQYQHDGNCELSGLYARSAGDYDNRGGTMQSRVRRLTPIECERLQGFPDNWSRYGINEKGEEYELSRTARYKLQGNSIARPFWTWLLKRISAQYEQTPTLGGLFEGQGGFTLCALEAGIKPKWSSEVEKNAVSVLRKHFGDMEMAIEGDLRGGCGQLDEL